jgi:adenosylmethionine-8-amino-7-oxononanoate aminotransferase
MDALEPLASDPSVSEVRGGTGLLAAVGIDPDAVPDMADAVAQVVKGARSEGVLVRGLAAGIALSPPLTAEPEHFQQAADAIAAGLRSVARQRSNVASS